MGLNTVDSSVDYRPMVAQMDAEGFGSCSNTGSCAAVCPKEISLNTITQLNREYRQARF